MLEELVYDLRYAVRTLSKSPGFTAVAVLALALGIGANTAMFSVSYGILMRPLPYPQADRVALVFMDWLHRGNPRANMSMADYLDWKSQNHAFEAPAAYSGFSLFDITGAGQPEQIVGAAVTAGVFSVLRVQPAAGRLFSAGEDRPGSPRLAIIGEALWRRMNGSPGALGQSIILNGVPHTIVGVMPAAFHFPRPESEVWTNLEVVPPTRHGPYFLHGIARLKPGVTLEQAQKECEAIGRWIERQNPKIYAQLHLPVLSMRDALTERVSSMILVLAGAVGLVLLIAVVNVANLSLARATVREREMALRLSLGADRWRLVRQLLTESVLLAALGGVAGLGLAYGAIELLRASNPGALPRIGEVHIDGAALGFMLLVSLLTGVLFGLFPALESARADLNSTLKEGGRSGATGSHRRGSRSALVVAEVALSLMLLVGAGLLLRSFLRLQQVDAGFHAPPRQILSLTISPAARQYADPATGIAFHERLLRRIQQVPGLDAVSLSDGLPPAQESDADTFTIQGQILPSDASNPVVSVGIISPDYFRTLEVPLRQGRFFTEHDTPTSPPVAIVSENFARRFFPGENPLGKRIKQSGPSLTGSPFMEIVGVVGDLKYAGLDRNDDAAYYMPYTQNYARRTFLVVRSSRNVTSFAPLLRREVEAIDKDIVIGSVSTLEQDVASSLAQPRFDAWLVGAFAAIALLMAVIGIYGVIAYSVAQRTHEIGIRMALGAGGRSVVAMVLGQGARLAAMGVALGLGGAFALTRLLGTLLFGVSVTDAFTFTTVALGLFAVALLASLIPAQRATRISPVNALRQ